MAGAAAEPTARHGLVKTRWFPIGLAALTALGLALRTAELTRESFWLDEAGRAAIAVLPVPAIPLAVRAIELSPPLYHLLLAVWARLVGDGDSALRLLSALLGTAAIPLTYAVARALADRRVALLTAALAAAAPLYVTYSREAAMYALLLVLALLSTLALVALLRHGTTRGRAAAYLTATLALLYTHYYGLFVVAAQNAVALFWWRSPPRRAGRRLAPSLLPLPHAWGEGGDKSAQPPWAQWWALQWGLALGFAPWVPVLWQQARLAASVDDWAAPHVLDALGGLALAFTVGPPAGVPPPVALAAFLPAAVLGLWALRARPLARLVVGSYLLVPLALALLAAYPLHAFRERGFIAVAFVPQLLVAAGLVALLKPSPGAPAVVRRFGPPLGALYGAALLALLAHGALAAVAEPKESWRTVAARIALLARDDDVIYLLHYASALPLDRYLARPLERRGLPTDFTWARGFAARYWLEPADLDAPLAADRASGRRVWAVLSHADGRGDRLLLEYLDRHYRRVLREDFYGVRLGLWEPRQGALTGAAPDEPSAGVEQPP
jgi:4-amino-4-deoxy-L-arabinose transferase-like glycosyltransferase